MRVVIQKVSSASVTIDNKVNGKINKGFVLLTGFTHNDTKEIVSKMALKISNLRIFEDDNDKLNLCLKDVGGEILSISQFTLYAKADSRRPSFINAMKYEDASKLYNYFNECLKECNLKVETGIFGSDMKVSLVNDGPVTIILDSKELNM